MAFKLTKADIKQRDELVAHLHERAERLTASIELANAQIEQAVVGVNAEIEAYNQALEEAREFAEQLVNQMREAYDDMSERWQEGDTGQSVSSWIDEWEGLELDELDDISVDPIEELDVSHAEELEGTPDQPE